jgi:hypothetical protein
MNYETLSQRDPRWADTLLGNSKTSTIGQYGCLLTCFAMLAHTDPLSMNVYRAAHGEFDVEPRGAYNISDLVDGLWPLQVNYLGISGYWTGLVPAAEIVKLVQSLHDGNPCVILVDPTPGNPGLQNGEQHYVLAWTASSDGQVIINDPWYGDVAPLCPRYGQSAAGALYQWKIYGVKP